MNDTELRDALRTLPRESASPHFQSDVLRAARQAKEAAPRASWGWRLSVTFAVALSLLVVVRLTFVQQAQQQNINALRAEHERITQELAAVKEAAAEVEPADSYVVIQDGDTRYIVDLDSAPAEPAASQASYPITD